MILKEGGSRSEQVKGGRGGEAPPISLPYSPREHSPAKEMEVSELGNTQVEAPRMLFTSSYRKGYYERALNGLSVCQGKRGRGGGGQELR